VDVGPYSRSRHPIYLGYTISLIGLGVYVGSASFLLIVLPTFTLCWVAYALLHEERVLGRRYGDLYARYRQSAPLLFSISSFRKQGERVEHPVIHMLTLVVFRVVNRIFFDVEVTGDPNPAVEFPLVVVANHATYLDTFIISAYVKERVRCMSTESVFRNPIVRKYCLAMGAFPHARYKPLIIGPIRQALEMLGQGISVGSYPEGERSWDGEPLDVPDAVVKYLHKAARPVLAINMSGNYNVFPRWARRPRRGKIKLHFHAPFVLSKDKSLAENKRILLEKIHGPGKSYDETIQVKGKNLARGLPLLLWRCPLCGTNDSLLVERGVHLRCGECDGRWKLESNYRLTLLGDSVDSMKHAPETLSGWYGLIKGPKDIAPITMDYGFLLEDEKAYLESGQVRYSCFRGLTRLFSHKGRIVLTDRRLIFFDKKRVLSDELSEINNTAIEGNGRIELGFPDKVISIRLKHESPLKWQAYIRRAKASGDNAD
jgi:1-acyl-sn-glycerol-3-phosphate acyltransferase